ncbi:hypothetical protein AB7M43_002674 [Bradyrhizobium elkanii]
MNPEARAAAVKLCATGAAGISPTEPQWSQIKNANHRGLVMVMRAGEEGVAALDAVDEAVLHQEVERAVDGNRCRPRHRLGQLVDHLIGAERAMARQQRLQHLTADRGEFLAAARTNLFGMRHRVRGAAAVIVVGGRKCRLSQAHCLHI